MKKLLTILITILMLFALVGCDGNESASGSNNSGSLFGGTSLKKVDPSEINYKHVREEDEYYEVELPHSIIPTDDYWSFGIGLENTTDKALEDLIFRVDEYDENGELIETFDGVSNYISRLEPGQKVIDRISIEGANSDKVNNIEITKIFATLSNDQHKMVDGLTYDIEYITQTHENAITHEITEDNLISLTVTNNTGRKVEYVNFVVEPMTNGKLLESPCNLQFKKPIGIGETVTYTSDYKYEHTIDKADEYYVSAYIDRSYDK